MSADLSSAQRQRLKARAHRLAPVAQVGQQGLTAPFLAELDRALTSHELIKVRLRGDRDDRAAQLEEIGARTGCAVIAKVGGVAILYRDADDAPPPAVDTDSASAAGSEE